MKKLMHTFLIALLAIVATTGTMSASSSGKTGKTATNGSGCNCHSSSPSSSVGFSFQGIQSAIRVKPNSSTNFTAIVAHNSLSTSGINVSVNTDQTGKTNVGTLMAMSGEIGRAHV